MHVTRVLLSLKKSFEFYISRKIKWCIGLIDLSFPSLSSALIITCIFVTQSGKTGLIVAHLKVSRNAGFKYSECCGLPMVVAMRTNFHTFYNNLLPSRSSTEVVVKS